jgi:short-subunit dehydrogenase
MNARFMNRVAVITGAGAGIGRALAIALANDGARLALSDIDEAGLARTRSLLPAGTEVRTYRLDVTSEAAVVHAEEVLGTSELPPAVQQRGSALLGTFEHQSLEEARWLIDLDLWSVVYCAKAFMPAMRRQNEGWIVNISSIAGLIGMPALNTYNVVKFAVRGLTECLWAELAGTGVQAVCVHPGGIKTNIERASRRCSNAGALEDRMDAANKKILVTPPEKCAADILAGLKAGKRRILTGTRASTIDWIARLLPNTYPRLMRHLL